MPSICHYSNYNTLVGKLRWEYQLLRTIGTMNQNAIERQVCRVRWMSWKGLQWPFICGIYIFTENWVKCTKSGKFPRVHLKESQFTHHSFLLNHRMCDVYFSFLDDNLPLDMIKCYYNVCFHLYDFHVNLYGLITAISPNHSQNTGSWAQWWYILSVPCIYCWWYRMWYIG